MGGKGGSKARHTTKTIVHNVVYLALPSLVCTEPGQRNVVTKLMQTSIVISSIVGDGCGWRLLLGLLLLRPLLQWLLQWLFLLVLLSAAAAVCCTMPNWRESTPCH